MTGNEIRKIRGDIPPDIFAELVGCSERQLARWEKKYKEEIKMSKAFEDKLRVMNRRSK